MALVIEDGTLVAGADSFVTRAEIIAYAAARGVTVADADASDVFAIAAMDYLWAQSFCGTLVGAQTTPFPRKGLEDGDDADDYVYSIPEAIKVAQLHLAFEAAQGKTLLAGAGAGQLLKSRKVGPMTREFFAPGEGGNAATISSPLVDAMLSPYICSGFVLRTVRA